METMKIRLILIIVSVLSIVLYVVESKRNQLELSSIMSENVEALTQNADVNNNNPCNGYNVPGYQLVYFEEEYEQYVASFTGTFKLYNFERSITLGFTYYVCLKGYRCESVASVSACCPTLEQTVTSSDFWKVSVN